MNVGDIVKCKASCLPCRDREGYRFGLVVREADTDCPGVWFEGEINGHDLGGDCPEGEGWFVAADALTIVEAV